MNIDLHGRLLHERMQVCRRWRDLLEKAAPEKLLADAGALSFMLERAFDNIVVHLDHGGPIHGFASASRRRSELNPVNVFFAAGQQALREAALRECDAAKADAQTIARAVERVSYAVCDVEAGDSVAFCATGDERISEEACRALAMAALGSNRTACVGLIRAPARFFDGAKSIAHSFASQRSRCSPPRSSTNCATAAKPATVVGFSK